MQAAVEWLRRALRGEMSPSLRLALICVVLVVAGVTAYYSAAFPLLRLSALGIIYVTLIDALGGPEWGIGAAIALAAAFSAAESYVGPPDQQVYAFSNALARVVVFLVVVGLVEVVRHQARALNQAQLRQKEFELQRVRGELTAANARFQSVGESIPFGVWHCNAEGHVIYMSPSFLQLLGMSLEEVRHGGWLARVVPEDAARVRAAWQDRHSWQGVWEDEYRINAQDGKLYTILCRGMQVHDEGGRILGWTGLNLDLTQRSKAREQLAFLVEAGRLLSMSLDPTTTLERVAKLTVPRIADWCTLDLLQENDELQTVAAMHVDPAKIELLRKLRAYPVRADETRGIQKVLRSGHSELYATVNDELLTDVAQNQEHLKLLRSLGLTSAMIVPLRARGQILGVMTLAQAESDRIFAQDDVRLAEILAARAALAYDNARNYAKEQLVAQTFQRASLPMSLPRLPGIRLHATYLPGATESEVGGDWYDAFQLPNGDLAVSIGDVAGKGLRAAVSMASTRPALRGCALEGLSPRDVLSKVNQRLTYEGSGMVTAMFGVLNPVTLELTIANAGHPAPLLAHPDGRIEKLAVRGIPLGLFTEHSYEERTIQLEHGALLVFYTDGLIEFDHDIVRGEQLLMEAVAGQLDAHAPDPSEAIVRQVILEAPQDDVAVLTLGISAQPLEHVDLVTTSAPSSARVIRQALRRFALGLAMDENETSDFLTASGEAISNVIEHAYGIEEGPLHVRASQDGGSVVIQVVDKGRWRPPQETGSGRGLTLMRALADKVEVESSEKGTTVMLRMPLSGFRGDRPSNVPAARN